MEFKRPYLRLFLCFTFIGLWLTACATTSYINVTYQPPAASEGLTNQAVFLKFKDIRSDKVFLSKAAQKEFKYFTGIFSLTIAEEKKDNLIGSFEVEPLFQEALKRRLHALGITMAPTPAENQPIMEISLKEFLLDLKDRKWIARINFETRLIKDQNRIATEAVSAAAERLKTVGRGDAEKVLGEIFTDAINKIDVAGLFKKL